MALREENIRLIFGLKLRQLRLDRGLSLSELAYQTGISISYLNEIEKARKYPKADKVALLAETLEVPYDQLVSLQLDRRLAAVSDLLQSNVLSELPLDIFGVEPADLLELLAGAPSKLSAFVSTLIEISRHYGLNFEGFYFAVLRSFQEMHDNYFPELEAAAIDCRNLFKLTPTPLGPEALEQLLQEHYHYALQYSGFEDQPALQQLRSLTLPGPPARLILHHRLSPEQRAFALGREVGYNYLRLGERSYTASWVEVSSFEQVLNNLKASYFSSVLLLPAAELEQDMLAFFSLKQFDSGFLPALMVKYKVSAETLLHRMTSLLPARFGLNELFFLRFEKNSAGDDYALTKELHLAGQHNPHATVLHEHYCRRWIAITAIDSLPSQNSTILCRAQQSHYIDSDNQYIVITVATPQSAWQPVDGSISIGLRLNPALKKKVKYWNDVPIRIVGETCERCAVTDCESRMASARVLDQMRKTAAMKSALARLLQKPKKSGFE
jgi:hypothetical protein